MQTIHTPRCSWSNIDEDASLHIFSSFLLKSNAPKKALLLRKDAKTLSLDTNGKIHGQ